ncbi:MAG: hypothetical protein WBA54_10810 [Acidaminobacteraceae bacterium]
MTLEKIGGVYMGVVNCKICGHIFNDSLGKKICRACNKLDDEKFLSVREFLYANPSSKIDEVIEGVYEEYEIEVTAHELIGYVRAGRLLLSSENSNIFITCEACGEKIDTGRLCENCRSQFLKGTKIKETKITPDKIKKTGIMHSTRSKK